MQSGNISTSSIVTGAAGAVAGAAGIKVLEYFLNSFFGKKYSKKNLRRLEEVTVIYENIFKTPVVTDPPTSVIPEYWILNDGRPIFCFTPDRNYHAYLDELEQKRGGLQNYYKNSKVLSKFISSYLATRHDRLIDNGSKGDFLELFYLEWLRWSAAELPHYEYNKSALEVFGKRLKYIKKVRKKANLLLHSNIPGKITKHNALDFIERELKKCIAKTNEEMERKTAHEHFKNLKDKSSKMLDECFSFVFYNRQKPVHELPLVTEDFIASTLDRSHSSIERETLPIVTATHTGEMLRALINLSETDDEKVLNVRDKEIFNYYFNPDFSARAVKWDLDKCDFPKWIPKVLYRQQMKLYQELCSHILNLIEIKRLIDKAYILCTYKGTLWAYGSKQGKESIQGLLTSYENIVTELSSNIAEIDNINNTFQAQYNTENRENYDNPVDLNLKEADAAYEAFSRFKESAVSICAEIRRQIHVFPENMEKKVSKFLRSFYRGVKNSVVKHAPNDITKFSYNENSPDIVVDEFENIKIDTSHLAATINALHFPFYEPLQSKLNQYNSHTYANSSIENVMLSAPWKLGDSYNDWVKGFFRRNENVFESLRNSLPIELAEAFQSRRLESIDSTYSKILSLLEIFIKEINDQRPKWRLFPPTAGWPFNRKADKFAKILTHNLNEKITVVNKFVSEKKEQIKISIPPSNIMPLVTSHSAYQNSTSAVSLALAILKEQKKSNDKSSSNQGAINFDPTIFKKWRISISDLINDWAEYGFSEKLTLFPTQEFAKTLLSKFLSYRTTLGQNTAEFLLLCDDIKNSYKDYIDDSKSEEIIDSASRYQINLLMRLVKVLATDPNSDQYQISQGEFNKHCHEFSLNIEADRPAREEKKEEEENKQSGEQNVRINVVSM
jgi:hypothetical protein